MSKSTLLFMCSGGGGNLRFVHKACEAGWLGHWSKIVVISDRECAALDYARKSGLEANCLDFSQSSQESLADLIGNLKPDTIVTTVHRILRENVLKASRSRSLNLHYSLLPSFSGTIGSTPVRAALDYGSKIIGATVHEVTAVLDGGKPVVQLALPLTGDEQMLDVMDMVFRAGCISIFTALSIQRTRLPPSMPQNACLEISGRQALISPCAAYPASFFDESFWQSLKQ